MPKLLHARPPQDGAEERQIRKLATSRHAPADVTIRARMIIRSWAGLRTAAIAAALGCHPQTVRERLARFNAVGLAGLADRPGPGRRPRLTQADRSRLRRWSRRQRVVSKPAICSRVASLHWRKHRSLSGGSPLTFDGGGNRPTAAGRTAARGRRRRSDDLRRPPVATQKEHVVVRRVGRRPLDDRGAAQPERAPGRRLDSATPTSQLPAVTPDCRRRPFRRGITSSPICCTSPSKS